MSKLNKELVKAIKLTVELCNIKKEWYGNEIAAFVKGEKTECMYYDKLKPLYDKYGYLIVNECLFIVCETMEETKTEVK